LLPLTAVARKTRHLAGRHSSHAPQTHLGDHALEAAAHLGAGSRTAQILVDHLDIGKPKIAQAALHRVRQLLTLEVVGHLKR